MFATSRLIERCDACDPVRLDEGEPIMPSLSGSVVLVTGANGGIGAHLVEHALQRGAAKVYATARNPRGSDDERIVPLALDITDEDSIAEAASTAGDVTVVVNNAGITPHTASVLDVAEADLRRTMEVNFFGPLAVARAFAPALSRASGAALVDVHSIASWYAFGGAYSASKAAMWSATNSLRLELAPRGVHVVGVHMGYVDTPMAATAAGPKLRPEDLAQMIFDAVERNEFEVLGDDLTARVRVALGGPLTALYPELL